jgi:hypothetical protein
MIELSQPNYQSLGLSNPMAKFLASSMAHTIMVTFLWEQQPATFFAFDSMQLVKIVNVKVSQSPVTSIQIEPTQLVLVGSKDSQDVTALAFIEQKQRYIYMELERNKFCTVVVNENSQKDQSFTKALE